MEASLDVTKNSKLLRRNIIQMLPACFSLSMVYVLMIMIDSLLAGKFTGTTGVAAVSIGAPAYLIFLSFLNAIIHGTELRMTWRLGRNDKEGLQRAFAGGVYFTMVTGILLSVFVFFIARPLVMIFGGSKSTEEIVNLAVLYIKCCAWCISIQGIGGVFRSLFSVMGFQRDRMITNLANVITNIIFSILFINLLPAPIKLMGLGLGSACASAVDSAIAIILYKKHKFGLSLKPVLLKPAEILDTMKSGCPSSLDNILDCIVSSIINRLVLGAFGSDGVMLSMVTVINNIRKLGRMPIQCMGYAASPLYGIAYSARDKGSLIDSLKESFKIGLLITVIWEVILYILSPIVFNVFNMSGNAIVQRGTVIVLASMPIVLIVYLLVSFFESTKRFGLSIYMASAPDSLVYPILVALLIPLLKSDGIWYAMALNGIIVLLISYLIMMLVTKKVRVPAETLLFLDSSVKNANAICEMTIHNTLEEATGISKKVQEFFKDKNVSERIQMVSALAVEEIIVDMIKHPGMEEKRAGKRVMDVKIFEDDENVQILIRNIAPLYNPLANSDDKENETKDGIRLAQLLATDISYSYVYKMNVVNVLLNKGIQE